MNVPSRQRIIYSAAEQVVVIIVIGLLLLFALQNYQVRSEDDFPLLLVTGIIPPYMDRSGRGREEEVVRRIFATANYDRRVSFVPQPFSRHWYLYSSDERYAGVTTVPADSNLVMPGYRSQPYIHYQNGIGYLPSRFPEIKGDIGLEDLKGMRVVAFAGASRILKMLGAFTPAFADYLEIRDQKVHSELLASGAVDAVIGDREIFFHFNCQIEETGRLEAAAFSPTFHSTPYVMFFRDAAVRDRFDRALSGLRLKASPSSDREDGFECATKMQDG